MIALLAVPAGMSVWTEAEAIAEAIGAIGIVFTLFYSIWSFRTTLRDSYYAELDRVYFELLKIGLERPYLLDVPASLDPVKAREYEAYAFMVWNFVETVFDRCRGWSKRRLRETWYPVIAAEAARHRSWFDLPENRKKFKQPFCAFIDARYPVPASAIVRDRAVPGAGSVIGRAGPGDGVGTESPGTPARRS